MLFTYILLLSRKPGTKSQTVGCVRYQMNSLKSMWYSAGCNVARCFSDWPIQT